MLNSHMQVITWHYTQIASALHVLANTDWCTKYGGQTPSQGHVYFYHSSNWILSVVQHISFIWSPLCFLAYIITKNQGGPLAFSSSHEADKKSWWIGSAQTLPFGCLWSVFPQTSHLNKNRVKHMSWYRVMGFSYSRHVIKIAKAFRPKAQSRGFDILEQHSPVSANTSLQNT